MSQEVLGRESIMSVSGKLARTAWLLSAILYCGCSNNGSNSTIQTVDNKQKTSTAQGQASGSAQPSPGSSVSTADTDPFLIPSRSVSGAPTNSDDKDPVAQLKNLQTTQLPNR